MPPGKIAALGNQPVSTGWRQPAQCPDLGWGQFDAIPHLTAAVRIIGAAAALLVEELAGDVGKVDFTAILVFKLDKTAAAASIAQTFPLGGAQGFERLLFPERRLPGKRALPLGFCATLRA